MTLHEKQIIHDVWVRKQCGHRNNSAWLGSKPAVNCQAQELVSLSSAETVLCCFSSTPPQDAKVAVGGWSEFKHINSRALFMTTYSYNFTAEDWDDMKGRTATRQTEQFSFRSFKICVVYKMVVDFGGCWGGGQCLTWLLYVVMERNWWIIFKQEARGACVPCKYI